MEHSRIFTIPEVLERILYFLLMDKSLYPALYVSRLWYRCGAPILWKRVELKNSNIRKIFMEIIHGVQKPVYCLNVTHLEIPHYYSLSDKKFKGIIRLFPNIVHLNLHFSAGFGDKSLNRIAKSYPNLDYLNLAKGTYGRLITDKGLYAIANLCHKLKYLNISNCKGISEIAIWNVIHSCPKLQEFDISNCNVACATVKKIELYIKIRFLNPGIATRYLEKN